METVILAEEQQMQRLVFWGHGEASVEGTLRSQGLITLSLQSSETWGLQIPGLWSHYEPPAPLLHPKLWEWRTG